MQMIKRVFLFILTNILVITTIGVVIHFLGFDRTLNAHGINYMSLLVMCTLWGFGGSFISLLMSKTMAKMSAGVKVIDPGTRDPDGQWLVSTVHRLARQAGIEKMPEVGFYNSPEVNAFATGATKNGALVAVSAGLMQSMDRDAVEGVLGHEIAHVANGDMVSMTLVQGVINVFVLFLARVVGALMAQNSRDGQSGSSFMVTMLLQVVLSFLGSIVVAWFSRVREYRADAGGAALAGKQKMITALEALQVAVQRRTPVANQPSLATLKISSGGLSSLFSTHPPLSARIARLKASSTLDKSSLVE